MISTNALITKINDIIAAGSLSELEVSQLAKAIDSLERKGVSRVFSLSEIAAEDNPGRIVFVESEFKYYISDGTEWQTDLIFGDPNPIDLRTPMYAWGLNTAGRLGDDTITSRSSPVSVVGGFSDWVSASAGDAHSLGVRANGSLWAWGNNSYGRLGDDTATESKFTSVRRRWLSVIGSLPVQVDRHSLGVRANGSLWAWGLNGNGRLGNNTDHESKFSSLCRWWLSVTGSQPAQAMLTVSVFALMAQSGHGEATANGRLGDDSDHP
jgi:hypothetical protein